MNTLSKLSQELVLVEQHIVESEGELSFHLEHELEQVQHDIAEKTDHYSHRIERLTLAAAFWEKKSGEAKEISKRIYDHIDLLKKTIRINMDLMGRKELNGETSRFYIRKNSRPSVVVEDGGLIPAQFKTQKIEIKIDKDTILKAIQNGETVPGAKVELGEYLAMGSVKVL